MGNIFDGFVAIVAVWILTGVVITVLNEWFGVDIPGMFFRVETPPDVFAEIDPDESLSAAFSYALNVKAGENLNVGDAVTIADDGMARRARSGGYLSQAEMDCIVPNALIEFKKDLLRVLCQFCGQPGERMTVCTHCGGRVA